MTVLRAAFLVVLSFFSSCLLGNGFISQPSRGTPPRHPPVALHTAAERRMGELTSAEEKVFDLLQSLHDSGYPFRIVVVGNGAILETTSVLGPALSVAQSPKTGKNLMTLASQDKSFEFHLHLADVDQIAVVENETPMKVMRLIRILGAEGKSMCSLILSDQSDGAIEWFHGIAKKYGETFQVA